MKIKKSITDRVKETKGAFRTALMDAIMEMDSKWQQKKTGTTFTFDNKVVITKVKNGKHLQDFLGVFSVINQIEIDRSRGSFFLCYYNGEAIVSSFFLDVASLNAIYEEMKKTLSKK